MVDVADLNFKRQQANEQLPHSSEPPTTLAYIVRSSLPLLVHVPVKHNIASTEYIAYRYTGVKFCI